MCEVISVRELLYPALTVKMYQYIYFFVDSATRNSSEGIGSVTVDDKFCSSSKQPM